MISTKKNTFDKKMTPAERKQIVAELRKEHVEYFDKNNIEDALYIPKMAFRPRGKDELHLAFFPSEFKKERDIYTEFVSIDYETEDPKRTLYKLDHRADWEQYYEEHTSSSGFVTHLVPVSSLKVLKDVTSKVSEQTFDFDLPNPDEKEMTVVAALERLSKTMDRIANILEKKL